MGSVETNDSASVRSEMTSFWKEHSSKANEEEMMLDPDASVLGEHEIPEIMSLLPDVTGKDVLELGAGIGRFSKLLAPQAHHLTVLDFMQSFVDKNKEENGHMKNITFLCMDVTKLELPPNSVDVIFSNWLFMYLEEAELVAMFRKMLSWLREGGSLFFRESCFHRSGNKQRSFNPTKYRAPTEYARMIDSASEPGHVTNQPHPAVFEIALSRSVQTYIKMKDNENQICWLYHKAHQVAGDQEPETDMKGYKTMQLFLDQSSYPNRRILRYEWICGTHHVSSGGISTTKMLSRKLSLLPGQVVLDVGCGIGGSAFHLAQEYDVKVLGMDLSYNMITMATQRAAETKDNRVNFEVADVSRRRYEPSSYDAIYSRDTQLHISNKQTVLNSYFEWLKPAGKLILSDFCCVPGELSEHFLDFINKGAYSFNTIDQGKELLEAAGFRHITVEDETEHYRQSLLAELDRLQHAKDTFLQEFSEEEHEDSVKSWKDKLNLVERGEKKWAVFYAEKPQEA